MFFHIRVWKVKDDVRKAFLDEVPLEVGLKG